MKSPFCDNQISKTQLERIDSSGKGPGRSGKGGGAWLCKFPLKGVTSFIWIPNSRVFRSPERAPESTPGSPTWMISLKKIAYPYLHYCCIAPFCSSLKSIFTQVQWQRGCGTKGVEDKIWVRGKYNSLPTGENIIESAPTMRTLKIVHVS